ncbi:hypothetical protein CRUP_021545 [Coryphaenoides rupestris]|nr:hypothetical protein CRUP_021545 [Coryphaenoides rupestris]
MLKSKTFIKKTRSGGIMKIVREHYLRDDIWCGSEICTECKQESTVLQEDACIESNLCASPHYLVPDTNVVLHQIDVLEDPLLRNVIILQTVLQEVRHRSAPIYKRLKDILHEKEKHFYTFTNEHHRRSSSESRGRGANDRNDRAIRVVEGPVGGLKVILITNDQGNKEKAEESGLLVYKCEEYIKSLIANPELVDRLALTNDEKILLQGLQKPEQGYTPGCGCPWSCCHGNSGWRPPQLCCSDEREAKDDDATEEEEKEKAIKTIAADAARKPTGRVVGIIKRNWRPFSDRRVPRMAALKRARPLALASQRIMVAIDGWPRHSRYPNGHFVRSLGAAGDKETEMEVLLLEHDVPHQDFSKGLVDPPGCTDIDDALHSETLENGNLEVGVHIADVSHFIRPSNALDLEASNRGTTSTRHLFTPADRRVPRIRIETRQASALASQRIMVAIDGWPRHSRYPNGHFVRSLGAAGDKETEMEVLLLEHDVPHQDFSKAVLSFLPQMPWSITPEDMAVRQDFRALTVCSVDPPGCTDIDDALHCRKLENGNLERIDMVPELLSSNLCSLRSNVERLAFSCIWEMDDKADIVKTSFTKSVINSKASLTYAEAQMRIDDTALTLSSLEVRFHIDSETHDPIDLQTKELMKHPAPPPSNYDILTKAGKSKGLDIHTRLGQGLADSLDVAKVDGFPYFNTLLRVLATRCMMQAVYFCSGMDSDFHHYGLASPIYTHFTSPIRRYSDIIVHRLLAVAIGADSTYPDLMDKHKQSTLCNNLNYRHKMSQYAQRASVAFHTQLFFKSRGILNEEGYILFVRKNAIIVLIPKFGLEGTVFFDSKDKTGPKLVFDEEGPTLMVEQHTFHIFDKVKVTISLDDSNIQHQKIRMSLVEPVIPGVSVPVPEVEPLAKKPKLDR